MGAPNEEPYAAEYAKLVAGIEAVLLAEATLDEAKAHYTRTVDHTTRRVEKKREELNDVIEETSMWKDDAHDALVEATEALTEAKNALRVLVMQSNLAEELQKKIGEALG